MVSKKKTESRLQESRKKNMNRLKELRKEKINVVGYQLIPDDINGYPITYILVEEDE